MTIDYMTLPHILPRFWRCLVGLAKSVDAVNKNGGDRKSDQSNKSENVTLKDRGNAAKYRIAKLKRDHLEIAKRLEAGEFKNVAKSVEAIGKHGVKGSCAKNENGTAQSRGSNLAKQRIAKLKRA